MEANMRPAFRRRAPQDRPSTQEEAPDPKKSLEEFFAKEMMCIEQRLANRRGAISGTQPLKRLPATPTRRRQRDDVLVLEDTNSTHEGASASTTTEATPINSPDAKKAKTCADTAEETGDRTVTLLSLPDAKKDKTCAANAEETGDRTVTLLSLPDAKKDKTCAANAEETGDRPLTLLIPDAKKARTCANNAEETGGRPLTPSIPDTKEDKTCAANAEETGDRPLIPNTKEEKTCAANIAEETGDRPAEVTTVLESVPEPETIQETCDTADKENSTAGMKGTGNGAAGLDAQAPEVLAPDLVPLPDAPAADPAEQNDSQELASRMEAYTKPTRWDSQLTGSQPRSFGRPDTMTTLRLGQTPSRDDLLDMELGGEQLALWQSLIPLLLMEGPDVWPAIEKEVHGWIEKVGMAGKGFDVADAELGAEAHETWMLKQDLAKQQQELQRLSGENERKLTTMQNAVAKMKCRLSLQRLNPEDLAEKLRGLEEWEDKKMGDIVAEETEGNAKVKSMIEKIGLQVEKLARKAIVAYHRDTGCPDPEPENAEELEFMGELEALFEPDQPTPSLSVEEPTPSLSVEEPTGLSVEEPTASLSVEGPAASLSVEEPTASLTAEEPVAPSGAMSPPSPRQAAFEKIRMLPDSEAKSAMMSLLEAQIKVPLPDAGPAEEATAVAAVPASVPAMQIDAAKAVMQRKDTTQLEVLRSEQDGGVLQADGSILYVGPNGKLETLEEQHKRLRHNARMRFNRSFDSPTCPSVVVEAAKGKRYNRATIGKLYEDWLQSKENWLQSALFLNSVKTFEQKRRGRMVMKTFAELKATFGVALAVDIRERKLDLQAKKGPDEKPWVLAHPDLPESEEHQLFRVFDALEFEDEESDKTEAIFSASGQLDQQQTQAVAPAMIGNLKPSSGWPGSTDPPASASGVPGPPEPQPTPAPKPKAKAKAKTPATVSKQLSGKIQVCSSKLTEIVCWENKLAQANLTGDMRKGYSSELTKSKDALQNVKGHMEALYAKGDSAHIEQGPLLKEECAASIKVAEAALNSFAGSIKAIKVAVEPPKPKAKGKAKAKSAPES